MIVHECDFKNNGICPVCKRHADEGTDIKAQVWRESERLRVLKEINMHLKAIYITLVIIAFLLAIIIGKT